jgi:ribokinase
MKYDICIFGGCSVDFMFYEKEDGTYNNNPDKIVPGGKASNQAVAASRAGAKVTIITRIGKDKIGETIYNNLKYNDVDTSNIEMIPNIKNDFSEIYIDLETKDNEIIRNNSAINSFTIDMIDKYKNILLNSKIIVSQLKIPKDVSDGLINFCYKNNKPIIVTPCNPDKLSLDLIEKISIITANQKECESIFKTSNIEECITKYPNKLIVTLGKEGVMYHDGTSIVKLPAILNDNLKDTTGAGDTFNGNLAYCLTHGYNLKDAITRSQYAAAMKVQVPTAQAGMPSKEKLDEYIEDLNN